MRRSALRCCLLWAAATAAWASTPLSQVPDGRGARLSGLAAGDLFGQAVAGIGDLNGDGFADLAVGAPGTSRPGAAGVGAVYVYFGRASVAAALPASQLAGNNGFALVGAQLPAGSALGTEVAAAGDLNGDGIDDLVVGSARNGAPLASVQAVWVVYGRPSGSPFPATLDVAALNGSNGFAISAEGGSDQLGTARTLAGGGDYNGDNFDDLLLGAPARSGGGRAYLLLGRASFGASQSLAGLAAGVGITFSTGSTGAQLGGAVALGGRVNNDKLAELLVGNRQAGAGIGRGSVPYGRADPPASLNVDTLDGSSGFALNGAAAGDLAGSALAFGGDLNGDGPAEVVLGAPGAAGGNGAVYVLHGSFGGLEASLDAGQLDGSTGFRLAGSSGERLGAEVARVGDRNGDGRDDLLLLAPLADPGGRADAGRIYLLHGSEVPLAASVAVSMIDTDAALGEVLDGVRAGSGAAMDVAGVGKFDGDAAADLLVGVPADGEAYLVLRSASAVDRILRNGFE